MAKKIFGIGTLFLLLAFGITACDDGSSGTRIQRFAGDANGTEYRLAIIGGSTFELLVGSSLSSGSATRSVNDRNMWILTPSGGGGSFTVTVDSQGITSIVGEITFVDGTPPQQGPGINVTPIPPDEDEGEGGWEVPELRPPPAPQFMGDWVRQIPANGKISELSFFDLQGNNREGSWQGQGIGEDGFTIIELGGMFLNEPDFVGNEFSANSGRIQLHIEWEHNWGWDTSQFQPFQGGRYSIAGGNLVLGETDIDGIWVRP